VVTGADRRTRLADDATSIATQFSAALLLFAAIALLVSVFVIYNTFAVLLAQRIRETALLRCLGATRRQVSCSMVSSPASGRNAGGVTGIVAGIGVAAGLFALIGHLSTGGLPPHALVVPVSAIVTGLLLGLVVTVASAFIPAVRATRTAPLAALRDAGTLTRTSRARTIVRTTLAVILLVIGATIVILGRTSSDGQVGVFVLVLGGIVMFLGLLVAAPIYVGPLSSVVGRILAAIVEAVSRLRPVSGESLAAGSAAGPGSVAGADSVAQRSASAASVVSGRRSAGVPVRLAAANARRNPARTAITTSALTIGISLMSLFAVVFASVQATAQVQIAGHFPVDYIITGVAYSDTGSPAKVPAALAAALRTDSRFATVGEVRTVTVRIGGQTVTLGAIDPAALRTLAGRTRDPIIDRLDDGGMVVASNGHLVRHVRPGAQVTASRKGTTVGLRDLGTSVLGVAGIDMDALVTWDQMAALAGPGDDADILVKAAPGVSAVTSTAALDRATAPYPLLTVNSIADMTSGLTAALNGLLWAFGGLIGVAILISLFGVGNTLAMSVVERTRESAVLRAIGLTRGQLRGTLLTEALLMGVVGALVGVSFGMVLGRMLVSTLFRTIGPSLVTPWAWIAGLVTMAGVCSVLAAVLPARRAARRSVVAAMSDT